MRAALARSRAPTQGVAAARLGLEFLSGLALGHARYLRDAHAERELGRRGHRARAARGRERARGEARARGGRHSERSLFTTGPTDTARLEVGSRVRAARTEDRLGPLLISHGSREGEGTGVQGATRADGPSPGFGYWRGKTRLTTIS